MELSHASPAVVVYIAFSILPSVVAFLVLIAVSRGRTTQLWLVPGFLASAAIAPVLAAFGGVRMLISAFAAMATSGGGIGSVSAGMWEAMQPSLYAGYTAGVLALITVIIAISSVINAETPTASSASATIVSFLILVLAGAAVAFAAYRLQYLVSFVTDVIDPHGPPMGDGIASISRTLANLLTSTAFITVACALLLIGAVVTTAVMDPKAPPSQGFGIFLTFIAVLCVIGLIANVMYTSATCTRLQNTAITGQVQR